MVLMALRTSRRTLVPAGMLMMLGAGAGAGAGTACVAVVGAACTADVASGRGAGGGGGEVLAEAARVPARRNAVRARR